MLGVTGAGSLIRDVKCLGSQMKLLRVLIFLLGLGLCLWVTDLMWPGFRVGDHFNSYPVTGPLLAAVAGVWLLILGLTFIALKKMRKR